MSTTEHIEKKRLENPPAAIRFKIQRREREGAASHWETFEIPYRRNLNVISALMDIRKNPVTVEGKQTTPPVWDMSCLEQVCGICTMVIDGTVRQSCSALIDDLLIVAGIDELRARHREEIAVAHAHAKQHGVVADIRAGRARDLLASFRRAAKRDEAGTQRCPSAAARLGQFAPHLGLLDGKVGAGVEEAARALPCALPFALQRVERGELLESGKVFHLRVLRTRSVEGERGRGFRQVFYLPSFQHRVD